MARLLFQHQQAKLKHLAIMLVLVTLAGCSKPSSQQTAASSQTPLTQKLQGMTPEQRTEYVKTHMDEVAGSAGITQKK
jgi:hypothetical protein